MSRSTIRILDVTIDNLTLTEAIERAENLLTDGGFHHIVTPGPEFLLEATAHERFRRILNRADLSLPDGFGLHLGARLTGQRLSQRVPGADFVQALLRLAGRRGWTVFLYGGRPGVAELAAQRISWLYPEVRLVGYESGYRGPWQQLHERRVLEKIHRAKPDILLVALGAPKQELWIDRHRRVLHDVKLAIGVGRTLDYLAGTIRRSPEIMRRLGLEWLYTYLTAGRYYQPNLRRRRVERATIHFLTEVLRRKHVPRR